MYLPGEHKVLLSGMDSYSQKVLMGMILGAACCESKSGVLNVTQKAVSEFTEKCKKARPVLALQGGLDTDLNVEVLWQ